MNVCPTNMAIRFYCSCGKHLRAREELAGRRTACPACGSMVGIPSLQPTHRGTRAAPVTVEEWEARRRQAPAAAADDETPAPGTTTAPEATPRRRFRDLFRSKGGRQRTAQRRILALEKRWYQCLVFPIYARHILLGLAIPLATVMALSVLNWPVFMQMRLEGDRLWLLWWLVPILVGSYLSGFLHCVLASAAAGEVGLVRNPGLDVVLIARSLLIWLVTFVAGPSVFTAAAILFCWHSGDFLWVDWLILGELVVAAGSYWLLALVAVHQADRLRDANPQRVAELIGRLGWRALLASMVSAGLVFAHGLGVLAAIEELHNRLLLGIVLLALIWLSGVYWATFFLRLLGIWCYRSRVELESSASSEPPTGQP